MNEEARRGGWGLLALAIASGSLLALGAFSLLLYTDDGELTRFWLRLALGIALAAGTVWAAATRRWLATAFLALASCTTPVASTWAWTPLLCIVLAIWALVKFLTDTFHGRVS